MNRTVALCLLHPLACLAVVVDPETKPSSTYTWTGGGTQSDSVKTAANWQSNTPSVPKDDGTETLVFGAIPGKRLASVRLPTTAAFADLVFTGPKRPHSLLHGDAGARLLLGGNLVVDDASGDSAVTFLPPLELGLTAGSHTFDLTGLVPVFGKVVDHGGPAGVLQTGPGGLHLSGIHETSTFSGGVTVDAGTLFVSGSSWADAGGRVAPGPPGSEPLTLRDGATPQAFLGDVRLDTPLVLGGGSATLRDPTEGTSLEWRGEVSGPGALKLAGPYDFQLGGANSHAGGTTIGSGTRLEVQGTNPLGTGPVTVGSGASLLLNQAFLPNVVTFNPGSRLLGDGFVHTTTIGSGVTLSPGKLGAASVGTLTFQNLTLAGGGTFEWTLRDANLASGAGWDRIHALSPATLTIASNASNPFRLKLFSESGTSNGQGLPTGFSPDQPASWLIFSTNGIAFTGGGSLADSFAIDASHFGGVSSDLFRLTRTNNDLFLTFTPVPEPSTYVLMITGLAAVGYRAWRRRKP